MTPLPAPVITMNPPSAMRLPNSYAWRDTAWSAEVRAEPNTVTLRTCR